MARGLPLEAPHLSRLRDAGEWMGEKPFPNTMKHCPRSRLGRLGCHGAILIIPYRYPEAEVAESKSPL